MAHLLTIETRKKKKIEEKAKIQCKPNKHVKCGSDRVVKFTDKTLLVGVTEIKFADNLQISTFPMLASFYHILAHHELDCIVLRV